MCSLWHFQNLKPKFSDTLSVTSYIWTIRRWSQNWRGFYFPFPRRRYCNAESVERAQRKKAETLDDKTHYMALCDGAVFLFYNFDISSLLLRCVCVVDYKVWYLKYRKQIILKGVLLKECTYFFRIELGCILFWYLVVY